MNLLRITESQRAAADPEQSVWVTANAGTGKTKVLTDRVLRLLLQGTLPEKILCLTYTRAAAAEMLARLQKELANWVRYEEAELRAILQELTGEPVNDALIRRARRLFLQVLEAPEGVRIMTIHSLCQSLLKRFALEAQVSPYFRLMEGSESSRLMAEARQKLFTETPPDDRFSDLAPSLQQLARALDEESFDGLMDEIIAHRSTFERWFREPKGAQKVSKRIDHLLNVAPQQDAESLWQDYLSQLASQREAFLHAASLLAASSKQNAKKAPAILAMMEVLEGPNIMSETIREDWVRCFLKADYMPQADKTLITKALAEEHPNVAQLMQEHRALLEELMQKLFAYEASQWSKAVLNVAEALLALHRKLKRDKGFLDYDDLIMDTHQLLSHAGIAPWILFKLDHGIDHLLVDEAQDTSPIQWQIIAQLADDFFSGESTRTKPRTLFVVGDEKQSIYSFQGADPEKFSQMKQHFAQKITDAQAKWNPVSLSLSFRSTPAVLRLVDAVFEQAEAREGVLEEGQGILHNPSRSTQPGRVELWPPIEPKRDAQEREPWQVPNAKNARENPAAEVQFARHLAQRIKDWLSEGRMLPARNRAVQAGDILILVRGRKSGGGFYFRLIRALKAAGVPVAGEDYLQLLQQLAVQDLLALCDFLLLPEDDLSLACVLRSPLFGISEEELYDLAQHRTGSLWQQLQQDRADLAQPLQQWLARVDYQRPYELLASILEADGGREKLAARLGPQVHDPLNELLRLARDYERLSPPSLQGFLHDLRREDVTIKREMQQSGDAVRVMTVHSSKGLQAPIVILPDMMSTPNEKSPLLWPDDEAVIYAKGRALSSTRVKEMKEARKTHAYREYRRLLYVALTRAADELYIGGWLNAKQKESPAESWYALVKKAMEEIAESQPDGSLVMQDPLPEGLSLVPKVVEPSPALLKKALPEWINRPAPQEPTPPRPLLPSRPAIDPPAQPSPQASTQAKRGTLLHKLFEILPELPVSQREAAGELLLRNQGIEEVDRQQWVRQLLAIIDDLQFAAVFGPDSLAEVPVTAVLDNGQVLSGQIDRLVVGEEELLIVDYKTSTNVPPDADSLPPYFQAQMEAYAQAIAKIYPQKRIKAAILWTAIPQWMPLVIPSQSA
jgi:ATP-dependent helicase/nuclease subunit A